MLRVQLDADPLDQVDLGFEEIDVALLVLEEVIEQHLRHVITEVEADLTRGFVIVACDMLALEVAFENFLDVLADHKWRDILQVRMPFEEDDAIDQLVGVLHFLDRFRPPLLGEILEAPVVEHAKMQPVLVDGRQLMAKRLVEKLDDFGIALHGAGSFSRGANRAPKPI